jgi:hypothetical protein
MAQQPPLLRVRLHSKLHSTQMVIWPCSNSKHIRANSTLTKLWPF